MEKEQLTKNLCPTCKTGLESYKIDPNSPVCPYIGCYNGETCNWYTPLNEDDTKGM